MIKNSIQMLIVLASFGAISSFAANTDGDGGVLASQLKETYGENKTLVTDFTQTRIDGVLGTKRVSTGSIEIRRPDKFRWETKTPDVSTLVTDGKTVWSYTPPFRAGEKGQLMTRKAADVQSRTAIDLLSGSTDIRASFKSKRKGIDKWELTPLKNAGDIKKIELSLDSKSRLIYKVRLFHATGHETELVLNNTRLGASIDDSRFSFKAPPNTELIQ